MEAIQLPKYGIEKKSRKKRISIVGPVPNNDAQQQRTVVAITVLVVIFLLIYFAAFIYSSFPPCPQRPAGSRKGGERDHWSSMAGSDLAHPGLAVVIMGVSGCGKSTVAALLAEALGCSFIEADDYHSQANKAKMSKGIPLTDADRTPWLESLRDAIRERLDRGEDVAVSCSALQQKYREILREGDCNYKAGDYATCRVKFVCLEASAEVIAERMSRRSREGKHFMPPSLLQSQVDLLQIDEAEGITEVDATVRPDAIVHDTIAQFREGLASTVC